jgi:hypothetical protein
MDETQQGGFGFGTLSLLMLEGHSLAEIEATARFSRALGLPSTLSDLKLGNASRASTERVVAAALAPGSATWRSAARSPWRPYRGPRLPQNPPRPTAPQTSAKLNGVLSH